MYMILFRKAAVLPLSLVMLLFASCGSSPNVPPTSVITPPPPPPAGDATVVQVDNTATLQRIDGFGGTTLALVYGTNDYLGGYRPAAIRAAFGSVGISLGMLDVGVVEAPADATDPYAQRANDNDDPAVMNSRGFNFTGSDNLLRKIVDPAREFGYSDLGLGPLIRVARVLDWLQPIRATNYQRYLDEVAENVLATMQHWRDANGLTPRLIHLFNEPTSGNVELASSSTQEVVDIVKRVGARLRSAGFAEVKFVVPNEETMSRSLEVARAILADPAARPYVGVIGFHQYPEGSAYSSPRRILESSGVGVPDASARQELEKLKALGLQYGVPLWMTEVSEGPYRSDFAYGSMEDVLARAIHIHDLFEYGGASAYFGMNTIWDLRSHEDHYAGRDVPFLRENSGMVLVDQSSGDVKITGMGYAVGHYASWLKSGAMRIGATSANPRLLATAFRDPTSRKIVVVAINTEETSRTVRIALRGATAGSGITGELSFEGTRWQIIQPYSPTAAGEVEFVAPPRSVVTLAIPTN